MYAHMHGHDVSQKTLWELPRSGNSGYDDVLQMGMARIQQKGSQLGADLGLVVGRVEGWWPRGFPKSITISPFWLKRFE